MHLSTPLVSALVLLAVLVESQAWKSAGDDCHKGRRHLADCNACKCKDGNLIECSRYRCYPEPGKSFYLTCVEKEVYVNSKCQLCQCYRENWVCGENRICASPPEEETPKRTVRESPPCSDGAKKELGCNGCTCVAGKWDCTTNTCAQQDLIDLFFKDDLSEVTCGPQDRFAIDCHTCYCKQSGRGYECIENRCGKGEEDQSRHPPGQRNYTASSYNNSSGNSTTEHSNVI